MVEIKKLWIVVLAIILQIGTMTSGWSQKCPNLYENWSGYQRRLPCEASPCDVPAVNEILYYQEGQKDPNADFPIFPSHAEKVLKVGDESKNYELITAYKYDATNLLTAENYKFMIRYALVIKAKPNSGVWTENPGFNVSVQDSEYLTCDYEFGQNFAGFKKKGDYYYIEWTTIPVDYSNAAIFPRIYITLKTGKYQNESGTVTPLMAYMYVDVQCAYPELQVPTEVCKGESVSISAPFEANNSNSFKWTTTDGGASTGKILTHTFQNVGTYTVTMDYLHNNVADDFCKKSTFQSQVSVIACKTPPPFVCETCIPDFSPLPGERYVLSAWVRQGNGVGQTSYKSPGIQVNFMQGTITEKFRPAGYIVDGWQQINGEFTVPDDAKKISIQLSNDNESEEIFFDDIRIQPFNSSLKSFVYDPVTLRLAAELDERNYASFYEYDEEGGLVRVKKETERGIKTISEARTSMRKRKPATNDQ